MATHDASNGTGGIDGSIAYELDRPEVSYTTFSSWSSSLSLLKNFGAGFTSTLSDFAVYPNKYISRADVIALGAVFGVSTCGGPIIPYRGGRTDVWAAGPLGVPQPQESLQTHKEMFARQGFTPAEMIQLTACGHTIGGVRSTDFPDLVPANPSSQKPVFVDFDTTTQFDNAVVAQYLDGTTLDPLVVTTNATMASDLRIFSADNNDTMHSLSSPDTFTSTCQNILERMVNVVAHGVTLTDEITVLTAKVHDVQLTFERNAFVFKASFRLQQNITATVNKKRVVKMLWCDRYGSNQNCKGNTRSALPANNLQEQPNLSPVSQSRGFSFINYNFVVPVDATASISKFWFTVDENDGSTVTTYQNGGNGYPVIQDQLLFVPTLSTNTLVQNASLVARGGGAPITGLVKQYFIVAAVRNGNTPSRVYMDALDLAITGFPTPLNTTIDLQLNSSMTPTQGYNFYTGTIQDTGFQLTLDIHSLSSDGTIYTEDFKQTSLLDNTPYVAPTNVTSSKQSSPSSATRLANSVVAQLLACSAVVACITLVGF
ncbi:hypothetical protein DXG01_006161 [Tephrocybe rancida]|nr:hypothetical protein DXG01_006161 [Tephrocybe rancida]